MRAVLLVIDSFGIGAQPDAAEYGDSGANTALHICEASPEVNWPNLRKMGLGNCAGLLGHILPGCEPVEQPKASFGALAEASRGKDTITGHWELAGVKLDPPFQTFPLSYPSFPAELLDRLSSRCGHAILGNRGGSGTTIIEELGPRHLAGEGIIVYTSADSVLQIAAHDAVVPVAELHAICVIARELADPYRIGRVIARPFTGQPGSFTRTAARRDFSMQPPTRTVLELLFDNGVETVAIGKIGDIFSEQGIRVSHHDRGNVACLDRLQSVLAASCQCDQFIFVNLIDTDMLYGHRRDIRGYHDSVASIDSRLPEILSLLADDDLLLISADHGCDPGFPGTDHTREYVPLLAFCRKFKPTNLGVRKSLTDVAESVARFFGLASPAMGTSFVKSDNNQEQGESS
ncbi:phosphopentomutase [Desulfopila aestuarii]|uniref:Phosphopentomutase n=1 Tax=Desulfopila aestuarii DSM 18488 TaxID=1121416 RepID=A0A1M7YIE7_9BACT|nr:phosphopentomutase [Desulfopila aestuarii]SHO52370.1 phosphopentomutase [Desulfopila aestuarii DSM 18488]